MNKASLLTYDAFHEIRDSFNTMVASHLNPLQAVRQWLDDIEVHTPEFAEFLCKAIPDSCPFERNIQFLGRTILSIPPLCKLNPVYEQLIGLRFRALCYLAEQ